MKSDALTCTKLIAVDRLGSGIRVSASFQIFALTGREEIISEVGLGRKLPGTKMSGANMSDRKCHTPRMEYENVATFALVGNARLQFLS